MKLIHPIRKYSGNNIKKNNNIQYNRQTSAESRQIRKTQNVYNHIIQNKHKKYNKRKKLNKIK